ncbi:MAG: PLP-dependent aminotransferase family protein [Burkholderiales bacterium]|nr:PLP-dependent aminotransferase family protein [Burkholderiales bacterium]
MVKQASGVFIQSLRGGVDDERMAQRVRVYRTVIEGLRDGTLRPGMRLPSARRLAADCAVSRGAVDEAFEQLKCEGLIERRVGDGSYIVDVIPPGVIAAPPKRTVRPASASARRVIERFAPHLGLWARQDVPGEPFKLPVLHPRLGPTHDFPLDLWRRLMNRAFTEPYRSHLEYGPSAGLPQMREAIARHLAFTRGVRCAPRQVLVLNSVMQAIELIARVLIEPGDKVWVEDPGHASLPVLFEVLHAQVVSVPFDARGLDVARGRALAEDAVAVYHHPLAQHPTGLRTDRARCAELLRWAGERGAWVIEGNYNTEIVHDGAAPPALHTQDGGERVLMVGTFEGILAPAIRLAYLVVPENLADIFTVMRGLMGDHTSVATQLAMTAFIDEGHMSAHLRELRRRVGERRQVLFDAASRHFPGWAALGPAGAGMHVGLHLPASVPDVEVFRRIRKRGVGAVPVSSICWRATGHNGLLIGYGSAMPEAIVAAIKVIAEELRGFETAGPLRDVQSSASNRR